jgi:thiamine-phosphate pyrophosphorylase
MHKYKFDKYYFISEYDTNLINNQSKNTNIIYRNYNEKIDIEKILVLKNFCKKRGNKFFLSNNVKLALKLNLDGVYLPSFNKKYNHLSFKFKKKFIFLGSAHSISEIKIKEKQGIKTIFISSIFKKNLNFLGLNRFRLLQNLTKSKIIALGGINDKNLRYLNLTNASGFAGITHFNKKKAP